jgi:hypothetical protein
MSVRPLERDVLVVVPTHDHASTLGLAVRSALEQTVDDLDVVIVGDGVGGDTRDVAADLVRLDSRVHFLDRPPSSSRGEAARHEVLTSSRASMVTYLGDDDLLWPDHVAEMGVLIEGHDFAHPLPVIVDPDGRLRALPGDLADPVSLAWHLRPGNNTVSLTGATHTMDLYRRVPGGWQAPPAGRWSDHFMWEQFFRLPGVRLATGARATTIKAPASLHADVGADARHTSLEGWWERMHEPGAHERWDVEVADAVRRSALEAFMAQAALHEQAQGLSDGLLELREVSQGRIAHLEAAERELVTEIEELRAELEQMRATRTWRAHDRLSSVPLFKRLLARPPLT